jgi:hypothetical protein
MSVSVSPHPQHPPNSRRRLSASPFSRRIFPASKKGKPPGAPSHRGCGTPSLLRQKGTGVFPAASVFPGGLHVRRVYVAGMGPSAKATCDSWRFAAAEIAKKRRQGQGDRPAALEPRRTRTSLRHSEGTATKAIVEGTLLETTGAPRSAPKRRTTTTEKRRSHAFPWPEHRRGPDRGTPVSGGPTLRTPSRE